jgi:hypothetical protein
MIRLRNASTRCKARDYFRTPIPEAFAYKLAHCAEAGFARHPFWPRKASPRGGRRRTLQAAQFQSQRGRDALLTSMRHWLAGVLAKENPVLFRDLPESFKLGQPLPVHTLTRKHLPSSGSATFSHPMGEGQSRSDRRVVTERGNHRPRSVHGCELLTA